jgi:hypothetical protein
MSPKDFLASLVEDPALLNCISREHFQLELMWRFPEEALEVSVQNLSAVGTIIDGALVQDRQAVRRRLDQGDSSVQIALPRPTEQLPVAPILEFQLRRCDDAEELPLLLPGLEATPLVQPTPTPVQVPSTVPPPVPVPSVAAAPSPRANIVKINIAALPPPFSLQCITARGWSNSKFRQLSRAESFLEASCTQAKLRVGRSVQPPVFWATLLPDTALQNVISREHFEVTVEDHGLLLRNLSASGTWVNGAHTKDAAWLKAGDVVGVGSTPDDPTPVLSFRLVEVLDSGPDIADEDGLEEI